MPFLYIFHASKAIVDVGLKPHVKTEVTLLDLLDPNLPMSETKSVNGFGFQGYGDSFDIGVDRDTGGVMIGSSIPRNSDKAIMQDLARCNLNMFWCKKTRARANVFFQRFQNGNQDEFEMEPLQMDENMEQCDAKMHDGCFVASEIEEYTYNYTMGDVSLLGKGITLDVTKGCATFDSLMSDRPSQNIVFGEKRQIILLLE